ncbi:hypothetical protein Droror1_Dr00003680 [Drosera rotundifolia]
MSAVEAFSVASVVEDVLQQHGDGSNEISGDRGRGGIDFDSRRAEEAASRRNEAASWIKNMVGIVAATDLPAEPSEEELRLALRSGMILCTVLNRVKPAAVPKVVESPHDCNLVPDGALSAYQYFENVRNFLVAAQEIGVPTFEASDLEQGGVSARIVNSILALKSYHEWRQSGGNGVWKFGGNVKPTMAMKQFVRKNSEPFSNSYSRNVTFSEKKSSTPSHDAEPNNTCSSQSLRKLVHSLLADKKQEEVPQLVESILMKVVKEFERRVPNQNDLVNQNKQIAPQDFTKLHESNKVLDKQCKSASKQDILASKCISDEEYENQILKQKIIFDKQGKDLQELKQSLSTTKTGMLFMQMEFHEEFKNLGMHLHGLANAASGYHRVLEENRKLYNEVQDLKGSIRVYCRIRPSVRDSENSMSTIENIDEGNITIKTPSKYGKGHKHFSFNKVFCPSASQEEVFQDMQPLIRSVLDGYNVCIFAYGQTGSGKTYTMMGPRELTEQSQGVNYRSLRDLFNLVEQRKDTFHYEVSVQMIEIYNEQVRDLLVGDGLNKRYPFSQNGLNVPNAIVFPVSSTSEVLTLMNLGQRSRAVGATALNDRSSRSHSCLIVHVQGRDLTTGIILRGCMHLVDLAGSERVDKSEVTGERLKEAQHINKSLSALGDVIASLAQKNSHVPYRNSKLTQLLQDSLGRQSKTLMFVHISPESDALGETISTLKFAERVASVELGAAQINKESTEVKELKEQLASLKAALARKEGDSGSSKSVPSTPEKHTPKAYRGSPIQSSRHGFDVSDRAAIGDAMIAKTVSKPGSRQILRSIDPSEASRNSTPWPPLDCLEQNILEDGKDIGSGEWVDKVMVNKLESAAKLDPLCTWELLEAENGSLHGSFSQKCFLDSSNLYTEAFIDPTDEFDAATSSSSEQDLLWQFNHSRLPTLVNGMGTKMTKHEAKSPKTPERSKSMIPKPTPSPSRKLANGFGTPSQRSRRQLPIAASVESNRRNANRKKQKSNDPTVPTNASVHNILRTNMTKNLLT